MAFQFPYRIPPSGICESGDSEIPQHNHTHPMHLQQVLGVCVLVGAGGDAVGKCPDS